MRIAAIPAAAMSKSEPAPALLTTTSEAARYRQRSSTYSRILCLGLRVESRGKSLRPATWTTVYGVVLPKASAAERLILSAPPLPPKMRTTGGSRPSSRNASSREAPKISVLVGMPTHAALSRRCLASGNVTSVSVVKRLARRFTRPGTEFCSCRKVGTPRVLAASTAGALAYPPTPRTARGFIRCIMRVQRMVAFRERRAALALARGFPARPARGRACRVKPSLGTRIFSIPVSDPTNSTTAPLFLNSAATHSAGIACPPVPPPAIRIRGLFDLSGSLTVLRYPVENTHGGEAYQQAGSPVAHERECHPGEREDYHGGSDVEGGLNG